MNFQNLQLLRHYDSDVNDEFLEFYGPLIKHSWRYDSAVGYFSSYTFKSCAFEFSSFTVNGGEMRMIIGCTPQIADTSALQVVPLEIALSERENIRRQSENYLIQLLGEDLQATKTAQNRDGVFGALPKEKM
jgi:hypothetical protein